MGEIYKMQVEVDVNRINKSLEKSLGMWLKKRYPKIYSRTVEVLMWGNSSYLHVGFVMGLYDELLYNILAISHPKVLDEYDVWLEVQSE
jgi:hypothetical protein